MRKNIIAIIVIAFSIILIIGMAYIFFFYNFKAPEETGEIVDEAGQTDQPFDTSNTQTPPDTSVFTPSPRVRKPEMGEEDLKRMAGSFAERFGSYSNQSDFSNVEDLLIFMTSEMKDWAEDFVNKSSRVGGDRSIYYGISTKAITEETLKYEKEEGRAEILVKTQRREATGTMANASSFYQDIVIEFKKEGAAWKVDSAIWQAK